MLLTEIVYTHRLSILPWHNKRKLHDHDSEKTAVLWLLISSPHHVGIYNLYYSYKIIIINKLCLSSFLQQYLTLGETFYMLHLPWFHSSILNRESSDKRFKSCALRADMVSVTAFAELNSNCKSMAVSYSFVIHRKFLQNRVRCPGGSGEGCATMAAFFCFATEIGMTTLNKIHPFAIVPNNTGFCHVQEETDFKWQMK